MVQCEMCGSETPAPKTVKIEGAELQVCDACAEFGTVVRTQQSSTGGSKYSTTSSSGRSGDGSTTQPSASGSSSGGGRRRRDMFDEMDELAQDYHSRIREAREREGLSQEELANELNEKASLIRKLERGDVLPSDAVQRKLERRLEISLTEGGGDEEETEWEGGAATGTTTLGDVVNRKD